MLTIDGSQGEGGGQILRTALSLAMVTGTPVRIEHIRAGRAKPGLMRQHLACVRAAQAVCGATVTGDSAGSTGITFQPGAIRAGEYRFVIGSAGSTTLLFQTVLPALLHASSESIVEFEGGTHNDLAPSVDFARLSFLPVLRRMGIEVQAELSEYGFYPAGGGRWRATIRPWRERRPLLLTDLPDLERREACVTSAMLPGHIAARELSTVRSLCRWSDEEFRREEVRSVGPGNVVSLRLHYGDYATVIETMGRHGLSAERVATLAVEGMRRVQAAAVPVEGHLADQLLLPMAIGAGGAFRTLRPSAHTRTNLEVIRRIAGGVFEIEEEGRDACVIRSAAR